MPDHFFISLQGFCKEWAGGTVREDCRQPIFRSRTVCAETPVVVILCRQTYRTLYASCKRAGILSTSGLSSHRGAFLSVPQESRESDYSAAMTNARVLVACQSNRATEQVYKHHRRTLQSRLTQQTDVTPCVCVRLTAQNRYLSSKASLIVPQRLIRIPPIGRGPDVSRLAEKKPSDSPLGPAPPPSITSCLTFRAFSTTTHSSFHITPSLSQRSGKTTA